MAKIHDSKGGAIDPNGGMTMPAIQVPSFRAILAVDRGVQNNILIYVTGGLGDAICTEPSIRYACSEFEGCDISVATYWPELYQHLPLKNVINLFKDPRPATAHVDEYFVLKSLYADELHSEFIPHMFTHVVDYHSLTMFRQILEDQDKKIVLSPTYDDYQKTSFLAYEGAVIHTGRTWPSRTIPAKFWEAVIDGLRKEDILPILIGRETEDPKLGVIELNTEGCYDLRGKLSIMETVALLRQSVVLLTNDSSPLHMAASGGSCDIGYYSTVKRPDLIEHHRGHYAKKGHLMRNLADGGMWQAMNMCPNNSQEFRFDLCSPEQMDAWLGDPQKAVDHAVAAFDLSIYAPKMSPADIRPSFD